MRTLVSNIKTIVGARRDAPKRLCGEEMQHLPTLNDAWLLIENGRFADFGSMSDLASRHLAADTEINAAGGMVLP